MTYTKHNFTNGQVLTHTALNEMDDQIALNETSAAGKQDALTQAQLAAVDSGITSGKVGTYDGYAAQIAGKQAAITSESKLSSDLVDATGHTNQFVTAGEKSTWNAKASTAEATSSAAGLMSSTDKAKLDGLVAVSGTNDGTNWQTITIGSTTKNIPSGGGSSIHTYRL